ASVTVDGVESMGQLVNSTYTFYNVTANHTIQASFEADGGSTPNTYTIIATAREHGTITPSGMIEVNENENQTFTFEAEEGYRIAAVIVDGVDVIDQVIDNSYTFYYVVANHTIEVSFVDANAVDMYSIGSIATYPNPNNGMFAIDFSNIEGEATYQLVDARGAMIDSRDINVINGETINFNYDLRPGTYVVRIITSETVYVEQIVVR
ncbi:MAG: T9SS type A sorting domain-containing protein, partial [Bacteroidales bacterium]|nr:T9SS type A sorting domain-containing protein [Bacteroidales bacterium]